MHAAAAGNGQCAIRRQYPPQIVSADTTCHRRNSSALGTYLIDIIMFPIFNIIGNNHLFTQGAVAGKLRTGECQLYFVTFRIYMCCRTASQRAPLGLRTCKQNMTACSLVECRTLNRSNRRRNNNAPYRIALRESTPANGGNTTLKNHMLQFVAVAEGFASCLCY